MSRVRYPTGATDASARPTSTPGRRTTSIQFAESISVAKRERSVNATTM